MLCHFDRQVTALNAKCRFGTPSHDCTKCKKSARHAEYWDANPVTPVR